MCLFVKNYLKNKQQATSLSNLILRILKLLFNFGKHVSGESVHVVLFLPAPILTSAAIIKGIRPGIGDGLSAIGLVVDGEVGHVLLDVFSKLGGSEGHGGDVVDALRELAAVGFNEFESTAETIGHVHHGERGVGAQEASVVVVLDGLVEDIDGVIGGAAARKGLVGDNTGISAATEIEALSVVVVFTEEFEVDLGDTVHGGRSHDGLIGSHFLGSGRTESANGGGNVETALVLTSDFNNVFRAVDIDFESLLRHLFTNGRKKSAKMDNPGDAVFSNETSDVGLVGDIEESRGTGNLEFSVGEAEIGGNDVVNTVLLTKDYNNQGQEKSTYE